VDVTIGSKCHCGRSELGRNVQAAPEQIFRRSAGTLSRVAIQQNGRNGQNGYSVENSRNIFQIRYQQELVKETHIQQLKQVFTV
jgi:hypothetical protein